MTNHWDLSLLKKCEDFLLHPTVRALSLAQRVDFLEKKGLSPEEITQCLKTVERHNGLSQLAQRTSDHLTTLKASSDKFTSSLQLMRTLCKKYGLVTLLLTLVSYAYVQLKMRKTQQQLLQHERDKTQRRKRRYSRVEALLAVIKDQQLQYKQAAMLLGARITKYSKEATLSTKVGLSATLVTRKLELQALESELMTIKRAVVASVMQPQSRNKGVEESKEVSIILRPALACGIERQKRMEVVHYERIPIQLMKAGERIQKQSEISDQTTMSLKKLTELFECGQAREELSTAGSYRVLFAS